MLDNSDKVDDVYFSGFARQEFIGLSEEDINNALEKRRKELENLADKYEKVFYINSFHFAPLMHEQKILQEDIRRYVETLSPYAHLIFIGPTPIFQTGPQSCVLLSNHCELDRSVDQEYQKEFFTTMQMIAQEYENVSVFYPYNEICPDKKCVIYDRDRDHLYYMDDDHLSVEESKYLTPVFDHWLNKIIK